MTTSKTIAIYEGLSNITKLRLLLYGYRQEELSEHYYEFPAVEDDPVFNEDFVLNHIKSEDYKQFLLKLDPTNWKEQDHYEVLGLKHMRFAATDEHIKSAYRKIILVHHPDKVKSSEASDSISEYFTCITKANDILSVPLKRRSYDSIDPSFDNTLPSLSIDPRLFYKEFGEAFRRNARWSIRQPVPPLGGPFDAYESVDRFYSFWYDFESWREYSYLDEEDKEKAECREERRYLDKLNKQERQQRKKDEMSRIRQLVDAAYAQDPRVKRFKEVERIAKEARKNAKYEAVRRRQEEEKRRREEAERQLREQRDKDEAEAKAKADEEKRARDAQKQAMRVERKWLKTVVKANDYFAPRADDDDRVRVMEQLENVLARLSLGEMQRLTRRMKGLDSPDSQLVNGHAESNGHLDQRETDGLDVRIAGEQYLLAVENLERRMVEEREQLMTKAVTEKASQKTESGGGKWTPEMNEMLVKAVNLFPAGTVNRWEVIAEYINQHCPGATCNGKQVLKRAKELQKLNPTEKKAASANAFDKFQASHAPSLKVRAAEIDGGVSVRCNEGTSTTASSSSSTTTEPLPWTPEEQKLLEQALKTFDAKTPERWDRIAVCVPSRSKKECIRRFKELAEMVKAKKAVLAKKT